MRRILLWMTPILLLAMIVGIPALTSAEDAAAKEIQRTLDVTGRGTISVKPDTAVIVLGVTALESSPTEAYRAVAKSMNSVAAAMKERGVKEEDIKTQQLHLGAEYDWTRDGGQVLKGYRASTTIAISTQKLDQVAELIEAAVAVGVNQLQSISYTVKDAEAVVQAAMDAAVDDAKAKANRVAARLGTTVVSALKVSIMDGGAPMLPVARAMKAEGMDAALPVFGGTTDVSVSVSVTFEIK